MPTLDLTIDGPALTARPRSSIPVGQENGEYVPITPGDTGSIRSTGCSRAWYWEMCCGGADGSTVRTYRTVATATIVVYGIKSLIMVGLAAWLLHNSLKEGAGFAYDDESAAFAIVTIALGSITFLHIFFALPEAVGFENDKLHIAANVCFLLTSGAALATGIIADRADNGTDGDVFPKAGEGDNPGMALWIVGSACLAVAVFGSIMGLMRHVRT